MPQYLVANQIKTDGVINLVENKLGSVKQYGVDIGEHLLGSLSFAVFSQEPQNPVHGCRDAI